MKKELAVQARRWAFMICVLLPLLCGAAQFVELTAEVEINDWDYWFFCDRIGKYPGQEGVPSIFSQIQTRRCVVGKDTWMIESELPRVKVSWWFTGTNIIEYTVVTKETPEAVLKKVNEAGRIAVTALPKGYRYARAYESVDGNPGRPVRVADLMVSDTAAGVSWLAFCSGPALKRAGRQIFPPSGFWKESSIPEWGWRDVTEVFQDGLGSPKSINLVSTNNQSIFRYQVRQTTNVVGWNFPLEFYGVQYQPTGTNNWKLHLTLRGRVTGIGVGSRPEIPEDVMKVMER
jgi:hypothetical protein